MPSKDAANLSLPDTIEVTKLPSCARCTLDHESVTFTKMAIPIDDMPYWAPCPMNGDPILLQVTIDPAQALPLEDK